MTAQSTIDDRTAKIIRSALGAARAGRIKEACEIGERGLAEGGDAPALHAMLGAFLCGARDFQSAIDHLEIAHLSRPLDPVIGRNLATALTATERYEGVRDVLTDEMLAQDRNTTLLRIRGFAAQMSSDFTGAIADFKRVVEAEPTDWETWNNLGNARLDSGDAAGAVLAFRQAAEINAAAAPTRLNLARTLRDSGDLLGAEQEFRSMATDFTDDAVPLVDLYHILKGERPDEAQQALEDAIRRDAANAELRIALGNHQLGWLHLAEAEQTFRSTLEIDPSCGEAYLGLAVVMEHQSPGKLNQLANQAERAQIDEHRLSLVRAFAARRSKAYEEGLSALESVPRDFEPATRWHLAGQMMEALGRFDEAFAAFTSMNEAQAADASNPLRRAAELRARLHGQLGTTTTRWKDLWAAGPVIPERPAPVFIAGFPRSGTTLLDTMLMGHADVEVMEEPPIFRQLDIEFGGFDELAKLDDGQVRQAQRRYFELARNHAELRDGSLLIDKSPLYLQRVPQICRLFPEARFILALRHPADVMLSCFTSNFRLNSSMSNFLQLDTGAEFYDLSFRMWERARSLFSIDVHNFVYERMIEDPEGSLRPLVEWLGLQWSPEMLDHQRIASERGVITTASYAQVTQPLYRSAVGRWQNYRKYLEPVLPTLQPWVEKFGYSL